MTFTRHPAGDLPRAWLADHVLADIRGEASRHARDETGGMLLGHWHDDDVVVAATIGPGPLARRGPTWLHPDHDWQLDELARVYSSSGRTTTYLGDWHTHPGGAPRPSRRDRRTLRAIRRAPQARAARPLMLILGPNMTDSPAMWCLLAGRRPVRLAPEGFEATAENWPARHRSQPGIDPPRTSGG